MYFKLPDKCEVCQIDTLALKLTYLSLDPLFDVSVSNFCELMLVQRQKI